MTGGPTRHASRRGSTCDFVAKLPDERAIWIEVDGLDGARPGRAYEDGHPKIAHYYEKGLEFAVVKRPGELRKALHESSQGRLVQRLPERAARRFVELGSQLYTDEELRDGVRRACEELGRAPTQAEFDAMEGPCAQTVDRRIGWADTIEALGYRTKRIRGRATDR